MKIISHRGNISGPNPDKENHPDYISCALFKVFDVEIDVWFINNEFWLGHDAPKYKVHKDYLTLQLLRIYIHYNLFDQ